MKTTIVVLVLSAFLGAGNLVAGPVALNPLDGIITGQPGQTVGWGFTIQSDPVLWTSFIATFTLGESDSSIGFYTDFLGLQGGPSNFVLAPASPDWVQSFNGALQTGIGSFTMFPGTLPGMDTGTIHVEYALFSADPNSCLNCSAGTGEVDLPFSVQVTAAVPEPGTWTLFAASLIAVGAASALRRRRDLRREKM
jgi:hypothetical protein